MKELDQVGQMSPSERRAFALKNAEKWEKEAVEKADAREAQAMKVKASVDVFEPGVELVNGQEWQELREENKYNLLITFYLPTCPYCKQFVLGEDAPLNAISNTLDHMDIGVKAVKMDVKAEDEPILLNSVPAVYLFTKEGLAIEFEGNYLDKSAVNDWVVKQVSPQKTSLIEHSSVPAVQPKLSNTSEKLVQVPVSQTVSQTVCKVQHQIETLSSPQWNQLHSAKEHDYLMVFYAPWCSYSNAFSLSKFSPLKALKESLAKVNGPKVVQFDVHANIAPISVKSVPSVVMFRKTGEVIEYQGIPRNVQGLMTWALDSASPVEADDAAKGIKPHFLQISAQP